MLAGDATWAGTVRFAAAVDVSDPEAVGFARSILHTAGFLALGCRGHLDVLYSEREQRDETVRMERAVKLAQLVREFHVGVRATADVQRCPGGAVAAADRRARIRRAGAGCHESSIWFRQPVRNLSSRLVDASDGDVVLVKPTRRPLPWRARGSDHAASNASISASSSSELIGLLVMRRCASPCEFAHRRGSVAGDQHGLERRATISRAAAMTCGSGAAALEVIVGDQQVELGCCRVTAAGPLPPSPR